jgi:hypothetical protein
MANPDQIAILRTRVGEGFSDIELGAILDRFKGDMDLATAEVWEIRAGQYSALVDMSESGSSRSMSQMYKNAIELARYFRKKHDDDIVDPGELGRTHTRKITRP